MNAFNHDIITIKQKHSDFLHSLSLQLMFVMYHLFVCLFVYLSVCAFVVLVCCVCVRLLINCIFLCVRALIYYWFADSLIPVELSGFYFSSNWLAFCY